METETKSRVVTLKSPDKWAAETGALAAVNFRHPSSTTSTEVTLTASELQSIVQQAYDQFGILAEPSLEREAKRFAEAVSDLGREVVETIQGHAAAAHEQQRANASLPANYLDALSREPKAFA